MKTTKELIEEALTLLKGNTWSSPEQVEKWFEKTLKAIAEQAREEESKEIVICAAVKDVEGKVYRCHRHADGYLAIKHRGQEPDELAKGEGFITSKNRFVGREEARKLQVDAGTESAWNGGYCDPTRLFSEDLY